MVVGDLMAQQFQSHFGVVKDDEELTKPLNEIGQRVLQALPPSPIHFQFVLIDLPVVNAFGIPGGRIYVTRKMIAFVQDEQELAGLLAHEIGHTYTHQQAIELSQVFRQVLNVSSLGDRGDVEAKYNLLWDRVTSKPVKMKWGNEERGQDVADQLALFALARAGYDPKSFGAFFDRLAGTHGETGNFFSDLFGVTSSGSKRLRQILNTTGKLPANCAEAKPTSDPATFKAWQQRVIEYSFAASSLAAKTNLNATQLAPQLPTRLRSLSFSPDGRYLLAQDSGGVTVLSRDPLSVLFRVPAFGLAHALFTPDSSKLEVSTGALRVESWDIARRARVSVHEVAISTIHCSATALSPNGDQLACLDSSTGLYLLDVNTGATIVKDKHFGFGEFDEVFKMVLSLGWVALLPPNMAFSPDARYLVVASAQRVFAYDTSSHREITLSSTLGDHLKNGFAFVGSNHIFTKSGHWDEEAGVFSFPEGKRIQKLITVTRAVQATTDGRYLKVGQDAKTGVAIGILDIAQNKFVFANKHWTVDSFNGTFATEAADGEIALSQLGAENDPPKTVSSLLMPTSPLSSGHAYFFPEFKRLALSEGEHGAIYDTETGKQLLRLSAFNGIFLTSADAGWITYKTDDAQPVMKLAQLDIPSAHASVLQTFEEKTGTEQAGPYLVLRNTSGEGIGAHSTHIKIEDLRSASQTVFERTFEGSGPSFHVAGSLLALEWNSFQSRLPTEIRNKLAHEKIATYLQVIELPSGKEISGIVLSGPIQVSSLSMDRDYAAVSDFENRIHVYSLKDGSQIGTTFGGDPRIWPGGRLAVRTDIGNLAIYSLSPLHMLQEFTVGIPIASAAMDRDGQILVLTQDQRVFKLALSQ